MHAFRLSRFRVPKLAHVLLLAGAQGNPTKSLPDPFSLLISGLWLLSSDHITQDLHLAKDCLLQFYKKFGDLYGMIHACMCMYLELHEQIRLHAYI